MLQLYFGWLVKHLLDLLAEGQCAVFITRLVIQNKHHS